jgi:hypothetical protein
VSRVQSAGRNLVPSFPSGMPDIGEITVITSTLLSRARRAAPGAALGRAAGTISAVALAMAGLAACSSSSTPTTATLTPAATSAPATSAAPVTSSPAPAGSSGAASLLNVCSVLTREQVGSIMGDPVSDVVRSNFGATSLCTYALVHSTIEVEVAPTGNAADYSAFAVMVTSNADPAGSAIPVSGLGQHSLLSNFGVAVQTAPHAFLVRNLRGQVANQLYVTLSKALITALGGK